MESPRQNELTLRDLVNIYRKRRSVVYATVLVCGILCAVYCLVSTRRYEATGTIKVENEGSDGLDLGSLMSEASSTSDALSATIAIQTEANILQSDTLALRTMTNLHMEGTEDFRHHWSLVGWVLSTFSPKGIPDSPRAQLEDAPQRRRSALMVFSKNLKVKPVAATRLIEIHYLSPDPTLSAAVVNELTQGLIDYNFQTRYNATNQASSWLSGQLSELRKQSEDLQAKVVDLERKSGVYSLGTVDAEGREQAYSGVLDQLQQQTTALSQAQQNRILKGAIANAAETGDAEMLSGLSGNTMLGATPMNNSLGLIQTLRQQEGVQQAVVQEAEAKYGTSYPKLAEMRANLAGVRRSIREEVERIKGRTKSDYAVATQTETNTRIQYNRAKQQADKLNDKAIEYMIVRQEAEKSRDLYEDLLKRLKEAGVLAGLKSSNITVVDPGRIPGKPKKPNVPLTMLIALGGGCFLGCLGGLLVDTFDNKISSIEEVEQLIGQPVLGATPLIGNIARRSATEGEAQLSTLDEPYSTFAEALRSIRTATLLTGGGTRCRVILVTSSIAGEGKSVISANLAIVLAQSSRRVLLVEIDMRGGGLHGKLSLPASTGLSELLAGQRPEPQVTTLKDLPYLDIVQAGARPPNPSELLDSKMKDWLKIWRDKYDFIVLDAPPVLPVTDALIVHPLADITLLLARCGLTERAQFQRSYRLITSASKHFVGVVVNCLRPGNEDYGGFYGYDKYSDQYGGNINAKSK